MILILIVIVSYLIGSIPSGYLVANSQGIDIRRHGSKNIGATNVLRVMGKKWGYLVFFCDGFKGFLAVRLGIFLGTLGGIESSIAGVVAAIACILGRVAKGSPLLVASCLLFFPGSSFLLLRWSGW